ncbi:MAG: hypothetical protein WCE79_20845 [Xanthobacteraceae bacterium]
MSEQGKEAPAEQAVESTTEENAKAIARFAQYTAPAMLAMLASAGKDMAFAQGSNNGR